MEVLLLSVGADLDVDVLTYLDLGTPIVPITAAKLLEFNTRALPYVFFLDANGVVLAQGQTSTDDDLSELERRARVLPHVLEISKS
ncbi:MAG: hypothetical protein ABI334_08785 [Candidatus Dormiibacterota bacterium]